MFKKVVNKINNIEGRIVKKFNTKIGILASVIFLTTFVSFAHGAYVEKVKGKKALIFLDNMAVEKGDLVYTTDASTGKKTSILRISTVKDQKAIGELVKGKVSPNQEVTPRTTKTDNQKKSTMAQSQQGRRRSAKNSQFAIGGVAAINFDSMELVINNRVYKTSGTGFGVGGVLDYNINSWFSIRGILSYDQFKAEGDASATDCSGGKCTTTINYLQGMAWGKINLLQKETKAWVGLGGGIWYPISKSSNAITLDSISTTAAYAVGGGVDMGFSDTLYIPVQLEYGFLPKSDQVKTSYYGVRAGVMLKY